VTGSSSGFEYHLHSEDFPPCSATSMSTIKFSLSLWPFCFFHCHLSQLKIGHFINHLIPLIFFLNAYSRLQLR
jgi:hypothetical protein